MENVANAWVRRVEFRHFAGGAVALWESTKWVTVEDCIALEPISQLGGYRRHTFFTQGQLSLFLRCWSEAGKHDFAAGHCAAGPNAFVNCVADKAHDDSGPIESWGSGVLYDNVRVDGAGLSLENRWIVPPGAGWSAANCVLWQCRAATIRSFRPPTANNWAIGCWAGFSGDGTFQARSDFVRPQSLYQAQLRERVSTDAAARVDPILGQPVTATNPTLAEAAKFVTQSNRPGRQLIDVIRERFVESSPLPGGAAGGLELEVVEPSPGPSLQGRGKPSVHNVLHDRLLVHDVRLLGHNRLTVHDGWLVVDGKLTTGGVLSPTWWRGTIRPDDAPSFGPAITRFVPGRIGTGFTDDLAAVADNMVSNGLAVYDHRYGLWYDRRRDDHLMVREKDGNVAPPFYEQPFARSAILGAWDGLNRYDLTKFNSWYWNRLRDFARHCDERGLVLVHQNYFQHNILEAGAHWADCPWRPANNVNDTGLPEPPPYIGDKRQFMAPLFYDVTDPRRRALHRGYIRQCLDNFTDSSNVIQLTSAEYSGPLEFVQFWLDTIIEWKGEQQSAGSREQGAGTGNANANSLLRSPRSALIGLSAPKDVQDAILADPVRGPHVDVIDVRYWAYTAEGGLYAPKGGQNLAPRQHLRKTRQKPGGAAAIVKAVREYRERYPEKAVLYNAEENCPSTRDGWATLIGGGSLSDAKLPDELARLIPTLRPLEGVVAGSGGWCLGREGGDYLIYTATAGKNVTIKLPDGPARYRVRWIDAETGETTTARELSAAGQAQISFATKVLWLSRLNSD